MKWGCIVAGLTYLRALGSPLKGFKLESNQIRDFRKEKGVDRVKARGMGPVRGLLQYPDEQWQWPGPGEGLRCTEGISG